MNILEDLTDLLTELDIPFETGEFSGKTPDEYVVIVPLADTFELHADNKPQTEVQEARLSLFCKGNYMRLRNKLTKVLLKTDFTITDRRYVGFEQDTKMHHYAIELSNLYELEE
jgi:hypothetical protein